MHHKRTDININVWTFYSESSRYDVHACMTVGSMMQHELCKLTEYARIWQVYVLHCAASGSTHAYVSTHRIILSFCLLLFGSMLVRNVL